MADRNIDIKNKDKYRGIKVKKWQMSQLFDDSANLIPYTILKLENPGDAKLFEGCESNVRVKLIGKSKGKGFAGVMKRWGFAGGPATHGQKDHHRQPGSIGAQGYGRVMPGKKMPGRLGADKVTLLTKYLGIDSENNYIKVKGAVPGSLNSDVMIYIPVSGNNAEGEKNEN